MTPELKTEINAAYDHLELLEHQCRFAEAHSYLEANRSIFNYDRMGNLIGPVANENGWTA